MTRQLFREKIATEFGLPDDMADAVMEITDGRAQGWAAAHNRTPDEWYSSRLADVVKGGDEMDLTQGQLVRADVYQIERVRKEYTPNKRTDWVDAAAQKFGYTRDIREAGYITPDGKLLDFSGKNDGAMPGSRSVDHRDIGQILPNDISPDGSTTPYLLAFASQPGSMLERRSSEGDVFYVIRSDGKQGYSVSDAGVYSALGEQKASTGWTGGILDLSIEAARTCPVKPFDPELIPPGFKPRKMVMGAMYDLRGGVVAAGMLS